MRFLKILLGILAAIVAIPLCVFATTYGASELSGEVVTLERKEADGSVSSVRIWIVDQDGKSWIEHGRPDAFWFTNLAKSPQVALTRDGTKGTYRAVPDPLSHDLYHRLRNEKYTWGDDVVAFFVGASEDCTDVPVRLERLSP